SSQHVCTPPLPLLFFFNHPPPTQTSPLPLHDALPILVSPRPSRSRPGRGRSLRIPPARGRRPPAARSSFRPPGADGLGWPSAARSEEHTSELQSLTNLVCRLLLEKKNKQRILSRHSQA